LDLSIRYEQMGTSELNHACTGNTAYRMNALREVGGFDDSLGYGYDNDLSYRLVDAGYRLRLAQGAIAKHAWPVTLWGYLKQQYGLGYGRLDLVRKHPHRVGGDCVSPSAMMAHAPVAALSMLALALGILGGHGSVVIVGLTGLCGLLLERVWTVVRSRQVHAPSAWALPFVHLLRDGAWIAAVAAWCARALRRPSRPVDSMSRRTTPQKE
jgi:hypothetical protein